MVRGKRNGLVVLKVLPKQVFDAGTCADPGDDVIGQTVEDHKLAVAAKQGGKGRAVARTGAEPIGAHESGRPGLQITQENIRNAIRIASHKIVGRTGESDIPAVGTDRAVGRGAIPAGPIGVHTNQHRVVARKIAHENVAQAICVVGNKVIGLAPEANEATARVVVGPDAGALVGQ